PEPTPARRRLARLGVAVVLPVAVYLALRTVALAGIPGARATGSTGARVLLSLEAIGRYGEMIVSPLEPETSIGFTGAPDAVRAALGAAVVVALAGLAVMGWRRRVERGVAVGAALALGGIGLVAHVIPFHMSGAVTADRLLYVPLAGIVMAAAV